MELKDFVKHTILDISKAIKEANDEATSQGLDIKVNPLNVYEATSGRLEHFIPHSGSSSNRTIEKIKFDVAVTTGGSMSGDAGAGINVAGIKIGGSGSVKGEHENISRIAFEVPVVMPAS